MRCTRPTTGLLVPGLLTAAALALSACAPDPAGPDPTAPGADPGSVATGPAPEPTTTGPAGAGASDPAPPTGAAGEVPASAMLPEAAWEGTGAQGPREEVAGVTAWRFPESCDVGTPGGAATMRTVTQGTGELESPVGVQQVAVLPDADAAVAETRRVVDALRACTRYASDSATTYAVEQLDVGAQGTGLATDYYGASAQGPLDEALGSYLAVTRRGTAVTVVGLEGGESTVGAARDVATRLAGQAWELLCAYDSAGC